MTPWHTSWAVSVDYENKGDEISCWSQEKYFWLSYWKQVSTWWYFSNITISQRIISTLVAFWMYSVLALVYYFVYRWILPISCRVSPLVLGQSSGSPPPPQLFSFIVVITFTSISRAIVFRWMVQDSTDDQSILIQVLAWSCQASSHYLSQCWPRSLSPNGH